MTPAELNIIINVRAKEARAQISKLSEAVSMLDRAMASSSASTARFVGTLSGSSNGIRMFNAALADLSKNLALISRGGFNKSLSALGANAALAADAMFDAAAAAELLNAQLARTTELSNAAAAGMRNISGASKAMTAGSAAASAMSDSMDRTTKSTAAASRELQKYNSSAGHGPYTGGSKQIDLFRNSLGATTRTVTDYSSKIGKSVTVNSNYANSFTPATSNIARMGAGLKSLGDALTTSGSRMQWAGRQMSLYFTAPTALAIGIGTKWILDLQKQQTQLAKVYGDNPFGDYSKELSAIQGKMRELSDQTGTSQEDFTSMAAAWAQAGKSGKELVEATKLTNEAMIIGDITADQAAEGMQALGLQWKLSASNANDAAGKVSSMQGALAQLNMASNITQVSFQDMLDGMSRVGSTARGLGFTFQETSALLTTIARVTGSAATAGNGLKTVLTRLLAPTKEAVGELKDLGIEVDSATWRNKAPMERLQEISKLVKGLPVDDMAAFNKAFAGQFQINRAYQIFSDLQDPKNGNFAKVMAQTANATDKGSNSMASYNRELRLYLESNPQKFKIAGTMIKNSLMDVVIILLPYILATAKAIAKMAQAFSEAPDGVQKLVIAVLIFLALIGPLAAFFGALQILFGTFAKSAAFFVAHFTAAGRAARAGGAAIASTGPQVASTGGVISRTAKSIWDSVTGWIGGAFGTASNQVKTGSAATAAAAGAGARATSAAWASGLSGVPTATATAGAANIVILRKDGTILLNSIKGLTAAELQLYRDRGFIITSQIKASGAAQTAQYVQNGQMQLAAVAATNSKIASSSAAGAAAAGAAGAQTGAAAVAGASAGAKSASKGGFIKNLLSQLTFGLSGVVGKIATSIGSKLGPALSKVGSKVSTDLIKGIVRGVAGKGGLIAAAIALLVGTIAYAFNDIKKITSDTFGGDSGVPLLARPFVWAVKVIIAVIMKLPEVVADVFSSVVSLIGKAAKSIYNLFSYINPFARHSPSLVENVQNGMAVVTGTFSDSSKQIQTQIHAAYNSISKFGRATAVLSGRAIKIETEDRNKQLNRADPTGNAARAYAALDAQVNKLQATMARLNAQMIKQKLVIDGLQKNLNAATKNIESMQKALDGLQEIADNTSEALDNAKNKLDYYSNAPIKGMKAMSDAIFENEMAQKKLQLQISKLSEAGESVDDLKDKYAALQGQIETLSGERNDLQAKGAGSDILDTYDKMIADLKKQQGKSLEGPSAEIEKLNKQLDTLKTKGDQLDLENSLQFDPLKRQIDDLVNGTEELDFHTIIAGVSSYKIQVAALTAVNDAATNAVKNQQSAIDSATEARDALQEKIDQEQAKLDDLKNTYDATSTAVDDTKTAMDNITSAASVVNQRLDEMEQAQKEAAEAAKKHKEELEKLGDAMPEGGFEVPDEVDTSGIEKSIDDNIDNLKEKFGKKWDEFKQKAVEAVKKLPGEMVKALSYMVGFSAGLIARLPGLFIQFGAALPKALYNKVKEEWDKAGGWSGIWNSLGDAASSNGGVLGLLTGIVNLFNPTILIKGISRKVVEGISGAFGAAFSGDWVTTYIKKPFLDGLGSGLGDFDPGKALVGISNKIKDFFTKTIPDKIRESFPAIKDTIKDWGESLLDHLSTFFKNLPSNVASAAGTVMGTIIRKIFVDPVKGSIDFAKTIKEWFTNVDWGQVGDDILSGLKSVFIDFPVKIANFLRDVDWSGIGRDILDALKKVFIDIPKSIGDYLSSVDWSSIPGAIVKKIKSAFGLGETNGTAVPESGGGSGGGDGTSSQFKGVGGSIVDGIKQGILDKVKEIPGWIKSNLIDPFVNSFKDALGIHSPSTVFAGFGGDIIAGLLGGLVDKIGGVLGWFVSLPSKFASAMGDVGSYIGGKVADGFNWVKDKLGEYASGALEKFGEFKSWAGDKLSDIGGYIGGKISAGWDYVRDHLPDWANKALDFFGSIPGIIGQKLGDTGRMLFDSGKNIVQGLMDGAGELLPKLGDWFLDKIPGWIKTPFKKAMGIASPSKVFAGYGVNIGEGLIEGVNSMQSQVNDATNSLASSAGSITLDAPSISAATTVADAAADAATATPDASTGAGLAEQVTTNTGAAEAIWDEFYAYLAKAQTDFNGQSLANQITADTTKVTQQSATLSLMTANGDTYRTLETSSQTAFYASQLAAQQSFNQQMVASDLTAKNSLNQQLSDFISTQTSTWNGYQTSLASTLQTMATDVGTQFQAMQSSIASTVNDGITPTISSLNELLKNAVGWFDSASSDIGTMWSKTLPAVQEPTGKIVNDVYNNGVRVAWSKVHTWLDLPELEQFTVPYATGGQLIPLSDLSNPNNPKRIANGGALKAASGSRDSTLFAGMRGEYVMSKAMVAGAGGISNLEAWRKAANAGKTPVSTGGTINFDAVPGFAAGGALGGMQKRSDNQDIPGVIQQVPEILKPWFGRTYQYGGGGNPGYDCSGWTGAVHKILLGKGPVGRIWDTEVNFGSYGYKPGKDGYWSMGVHNGGGGMNSHTAGTLAGVNYESGGTHNTSIWGGAAAGTINSLFEKQYYLPDLGGKFVGSPGGDGTSSAITPMILQMWDDHMKGVRDKVAGLSYGGIIGKDPMASYEKFNKLREVVEKKAKKKDEDAAAAAAAAYGQASAGSYGGGVERWRSVVIDVLRETGNPLSWDEAILQQMQVESSGNPRAINLYDSNALKGTPSKGLMQVIDPTFQAYRDPRYPNDIWDAKANIAASINYQKSRYGGVRYHNGLGYDAGGWLQPGVTTSVNMTGKPEAILTNGDWKAIYAAARKQVITVSEIADGFFQGMQKTFGLNTEKSVTDAVNNATVSALEGQNSTWVPTIIDASDATTTAVDSTTAAVTANTTATYKTTDTVKSVLTTNESMLTGIKEMTSILSTMLTAGASIAGNALDEKGNLKPGAGITFASVSPLIDAAASLIEKLPDVEPKYVSWAGTGIAVTNEMKGEKLLNDISNSSKGLYYAFKTIAPPVLKHTAIIGTAIEGLIKQDLPAWTTAITKLTASYGTDVSAWITVVTLGIKAVATILPLILNAILDIVPAIIQAIIAFFTKFEPDSVYSYGTYDAANQAVNDNLSAIKSGATAPNFETVQNTQSNSYTFNINGDIVVKADSNTTADSFVDNLINMAGG